MDTASRILKSEALENHEETLKMGQAILGHGNPHPEIASSLNNIGLVYH